MYTHHSKMTVFSMLPHLLHVFLTWKKEDPRTTATADAWAEDRHSGHTAPEGSQTGEARLTPTGRPPPTTRPQQHPGILVLHAHVTHHGPQVQQREAKHKLPLQLPPPASLAQGEWVKPRWHLPFRNPKFHLLSPSPVDYASFQSTGGTQEQRTAVWGLPAKQQCYHTGLVLCDFINQHSLISPMLM